MQKLILAVPAAALVLVTLAVGASAQPAAARQHFFVGFASTPGAAERALVERHGGTVRVAFPEIDALAIELSETTVGALARERGVRYVEQDPVRYPLGLADSQLVPSTSNGLYGLITTRATTVHAGAGLKKAYTGSGIRACVADTGLDYLHPDIAANYKGGIDTVADDGDPWYRNLGLPDETHGTHVAGTVLGVNNTSGVYGVAYSSELYYARVLRNDGGYSSDIMDGVRWLVEQARCKVVNMSLGGSFRSGTEENFYKSMRSKGALIVAASGNDSASRISYPAGYPVNIAVGAVDRNDVRASFSNTGKNLDVAAPGVTVLSSVPQGLGSEAAVTTGAGPTTAYAFEYAGRTSGVTGTLVDCGKALAASNCGTNPPAGFVALIQRGDISFADKVKNATAAGAAAAVIYNNAAGEFTGTLGSATASDGRAWIPAVSTSGTDGTTLKGQIGSSATVTNVVSSWDHYDGTSMATPHVSGVIALIWSVNPMMSNSTVEDHLFKTANDLGAAGYDTTYGHGRVNAEQAVRRAGG
ncbi:MAG: S8 family serine peptidase [Thermoleophilia bacterium]|nr:S8 family serine peptidase [Thermoleophilia bacterium]